MKEIKFYDEVKNWDFSNINCEEEFLTSWNMYDIVKNKTNSKSKILDLGTGGGEHVLKDFPECEAIMGTDLSKKMINTAQLNLKKSRKTNIEFRVMDNLKMTTKDNYYDIVVARNTVTDANQIYKTLKHNGVLILHGVDKLDCWDLKKTFRYGQGYNDVNPISLIDYEQIIDAGFKDVELVPIYIREFYKTKEDLKALLYKVPILQDFSEENINFNNLYTKSIDEELLNKYISDNTYDKGILLRRRYYGITANKR